MEFLHEISGFPSIIQLLRKRHVNIFFICILNVIVEGRTIVFTLNCSSLISLKILKNLKNSPLKLSENFLPFIFSYISIEKKNIHKKVIYYIINSTLMFKFKHVCKFHMNIFIIFVINIPKLN